MTGASRAKADAFLDGATHDHLRCRTAGSHLREHLGEFIWTYSRKRLGVLLRIATAFTGLAIAAGLAFMVWQAAESNGLLIEPFSVPPDLAARGLTGEVVAAKVLDRLVAMQSQTSSQRAPKSYANSWDEKGIKLDVPETGVSLTELDNFLRLKLGHDTHVSGEVVRRQQDRDSRHRAQERRGHRASVVGVENDQMDALVQRLAESIYHMTQPYRYAVYVASHNRMAEALPILELLTKSGPPEDRPWAYNLMALAALNRNGVAAADMLMHKAVAIDPDFVVSQVNIARFAANRSHPEQAIPETRKVVSLSSGAAQDSLSNHLAGKRLLDSHPCSRRQSGQLAETDVQLGAFHDAAREQAVVVASGIPGRWGLSDDLARAQAGEHDLAAARATLADPVRDCGPGSRSGEWCQSGSLRSDDDLCRQRGRGMAERGGANRVPD